MGVEAGLLGGEGAGEGLDKGPARGEVGLEPGLENAGGCGGGVVSTRLNGFELQVLDTGAGRDLPFEVIMIKEVIAETDTGSAPVGNVRQLVAIVFQLGRANEPIPIEADVVGEIDAVVIGVLLAFDFAEVAEVVEEELGGGGAAAQFRGGVFGDLLVVARLEV